MGTPNSPISDSASRLSLNQSNTYLTSAQHHGAQATADVSSDAISLSSSSIHDNLSNHSTSREATKIDDAKESSDVPFKSLLIPEIIDLILNDLVRNDCGKISLNMVNKELYKNEIVRAHAVEALCGNLYAKKVPTVVSMAENVTLHMNLIRGLDRSFQLKPLAALLANPKANIPMLTNLIMVQLDLIRKELKSVDLNTVINLQIETAKRLPRSARALRILNYIPRTKELHTLIESKKINPDKLSISIIDSIASVEHSRISLSIFKRFSDVSSFVSAESAAIISRRMTDEAIKCREWHAAGALELSISLLPKIISHDIENGTTSFISAIQSLTHASLKLEPGFQSEQIENIVSHFHLLKDHPAVTSVFCNVIDKCKEMPKSQVESSMLRIHEALKECGLLRSHGLCYKNAKLVQCTDPGYYQNGHRLIANTLPLFNRAKVMTGETVADVLARPRNPNERDDFLRAIGPYFQSGLCPYPN